MRLRIIIAIAVAVLATGCSPEAPAPKPQERIVKVGWDRPAVAAKSYRIFVDDRVVQEIPPPPVNAECQCLVVSVSVPRGTHTVRVVAYSADGQASIPATLTVQ